MKTNHIRYVTLTSVASLEAYIDETIVNAKALKDRIQVAAVAVLMHVGKHGDWDTGCRLANKLVVELGQGIQTKALADWFTAFGGVLSDDKKGFVRFDIDMLKARFNASSSNPAAIKEGAKGTHWCTFAPKNPWGGQDLTKDIERLVKKSQDSLEKAEKEPETAALVNVDQNKLAALALLNTLSPEQIQAFLSANTTTSVEVETFSAETK